MSSLSSLPYRGVGIGLRDEIAKETLSNHDIIDTLEIITENYFSPKKQEILGEASALFPVIPHGVELSIGSAEALENYFLKNVKDVCMRVNAAYYSDHFAITRLGDKKIGHLSPIWFTKDSLSLVVDKINRVQDFLGIPLVLENITSFFVIPDADFTEAEFIAEACRRTGCGLLLDITNVHINAYNSQSDPYAFLKTFPLESVVHIHLAGGVIRDNWFHDTHSHELNGINEGVWPLFEWVLSHTPNIKTVIIERDENFKSDFEEMIGKDVRRIRELIQSYPHHPHSQPV